jgi:membrane fusion protein, multidrug efflux system
MPDEGRIQEPISETNASSDARPARRSRVMIRNAVLLLVVLAALLGTGRWAYWQWSHVSETDARISADTVAISSRVAGWIVGLPVTDGEKVTAGTLLIEIDSRDSKLKLTEYGARIAGLEAARAQIESEIDLIDKTSTSRIEAVRSRADAARVAVRAGLEQFELARTDFERTRTLIRDQIVSRRRLDQVQNELSLAQERHQKAQADLAAALADVNEAEAERGQMTVLARRMDALGHEAAEIAAQREQQALDVADRTIKSPIDGVVSETFVDAGEFVSPGQRLMLIHNPAAVWVEANIKETDIRHLAPGMSVDISLDAYPDQNFSGTVARIGEAATSEFALLPNPNPSGNFTKVTQRLPVRIALTPSEVPLRPGMMAVVSIRIPGR